MDATEEKRHTRPAWRRNLPAVVVLILGISLSVGLFFVLRGWQSHRDEFEFIRRAHDEADALQWALDSYVEAFSEIGSPREGSVTVPAGRDLVTRSDFDTFIKPPSLTSLPGLRALVWVPSIPDPDRTSYASSVRETDYPDFDIREFDEAGRVVPAGERDIYYPLQHWASREENRTPEGFDLATVPAYAYAIEEARSSRRPQVIVAASLPGQEDHALSIEIMQPVYDGVTDPAGEAGEPAGFVLGLFDVKSVVRVALGVLDDPQISFQLFAGSVRNGKLFFTQDSAAAETAGAKLVDGEYDFPHGLHWMTSLEMAGRPWSLLYYPTSDYHLVDEGTLTVRQILAAGLLVSVILGAYLWIISNRSAYVERLVVERTRELSETNEDLENEVSERKKAEEQLRKISRAVEQSANMVIITDAESVIEYVNPKFTEITGYQPGDVIGERPKLLRSKKTDPAEFERLREAMKAGEDWRGEFYNRTQDGEVLCISATVSPIRNDEGVVTHFISVQVDITEQKRLQEQFLQAQRLEVIGRLVGGVAHDFNNILTTILGFGQMFLRRMKSEEEEWMRPGLEELVYAAERGSHLTRQLLTFARKRDQSAHKVVLNLNSVVENMEKLLRRTLGEDIELVTSLADDTGAIDADQSQVEQVVMNLAVNARDAMPVGGKLVIRSGQVRLGEDYCKGRLDLTPGDYVMLSVSDAGVGMSEEVISHVFEPFYTTKDMGKGTGLGLSTVFGIVQQSDGAIEIFSEPDVGTEFKLYFPRKDESGNDVIRAVQGEPPGGNEKILVVEDDGSVRGVIVMVLKELGYSIVEASNGLEALEICKKANGTIDLIFLDVVMPQMNGPELMEELKSLNLASKVIYTSGFTDHPSVKKSTELRAAHFVEKPFNRETLGRAVREVLDAA